MYFGCSTGCKQRALNASLYFLGKTFQKSKFHFLPVASTFVFNENQETTHSNSIGNHNVMYSKLL